MNKKTYILTSGAVVLAMAQILSYIKFFELPQSGSVTLASMAPILFFPLICGPKYGLITSFTYGILQFVLGGTFYHPLSLLLDYFIAFGALGITGFFTRDLKSFIAGSALAMILRYLCHFLSGFLIFGEYAPAGQSPIIYSAVYNSFILVEAIITIPVLIILYKKVLPKIKRVI